MYEYRYGDRIIDGTGRVATVIDERRVHPDFLSEIKKYFADASVNGQPLCVSYADAILPVESIAWIDGKYTRPIDVGF